MGNYIDRMSNEDTLKCKDKLFNLLENWINKTNNNDTIGDLGVYIKKTKIIKINLGEHRYYINADTNRNGVLIFIKNKLNNWMLIENNRGKLNKITNDIKGKPIVGFYMYKEV